MVQRARQDALCAAAAAALAVVSFIFSFSFGFVWDDQPQIVDDSYITDWSWFPEYFTHPLALNYYRPLFMAWMLVMRMLFGLNTIAWHASVILIHAVASALVYFVCRRFTPSRAVAVIAALIFAAHPIHIESVSWVSGATDPLVAVFFLGSVLLYQQTIESGSMWRSVASVALSACAMLTKETGIVIPAMIFVYALLFAPSQRPSWLTALLHSLPYGLVAALYFTIRWLVLAGFSHSFDITRAQMFFTMPSVLWLYVKHLFWPAPLAIYYDVPLVSSPSSAFLISLVLLMLTLAVVAILSKWIDVRLVLLSLFWTLVPAAPALYIRTFNTTDIAHDRYMYLPSLGFAVLLAAAIHRFTDFGPRILHVPAARFVVSLVVISALTIATWSQQLYYEDDLKLNYRAIKVSPRSDFAFSNLGVHLSRRGRFDEAYLAYLKAVELNPTNWLAHYNLGALLFETGHPLESQKALEVSARLNPRYALTHLFLARIELDRGNDLEKALGWARKAVVLDPQNVRACIVLGWVHAARGDSVAARRAFERVLQLDPGNVDARNGLNGLDAKEKGQRR